MPPHAQYELYPSVGLPIEEAPTCLPPGFPTKTTSDLVWGSSNPLQEVHYVYFLTREDSREIHMALDMFKSLELDGDLVNRSNFPLPNLARNLRRIQDKIHNGIGFFIIRGLDLKKYTVEDGLVIFLGVQSYIAECRARQDDVGNMIVHIRSKKSPTKFEGSHARHSGESIKFHHEETGDILAWQTRCTAVSGGSCIISSAYTIYNILAKTRPGVIHTLAQPDWPFAFPYLHYRPILFYQDSRLIMNFGRAALLGTSGHPRTSDLLPCTPKQIEALDIVEKLALQNQFSFTTQAGDMHFVNNLAILHRREAYLDDPNSSKGGKIRHLVRMRLRSESMGWSIPEELRPFWDEAFKEESERIWHVEPMPIGFFPLRMYPF